ncbi:flagellar biosynthetic protein FliO [Hyalangium rubrum]|uniref:Flagellar biosynthetic protein FliO n=1 Tax=Hyalangium rubrum TaxID=3103134 RepID=A0ABU5GWF9_9BACT|nr:flagellar biosynthetic protein FliO [Hyalangium sp. s54d21]MDY7225531.1 flagellar biosynthetic protein FliO [Hyalangium sp. s54d21]
MAVFLVSQSRPALLASALLLLAPTFAGAQAPAQPAAAAPIPAPAPVAAPAPATPASEAPAPVAAPAQTEKELPDPFAPSATAEEPEGLGWTLARTLFLLGAVIASIYLTLNVGLRRLMGLQNVGAGRQSVVTVLERVPLDQRRTLFVLKAADEYLLVGGGEGGLQLLSKLDTQAVERIRAESPRANVVPLSPFLQKLLSRRTGSQPPQS